MFFRSSKDEFTERIGEGKFLEYAEYCGNFYGTPMDKVNEMLEKGKNVTEFLHLNALLRCFMA